MKRVVLTALAGFGLALSAPLAAQTVESREPTAEEFDAIAGMFGDIFGAAEPLSEEEQARVGSAMVVVSKLFPKGTYAKMMEETMGPIMDSMMGGIGDSPALALATLTGLDMSTLAGVDDAELEAAVAMLDPSARERNAAMGQAMFALVNEVVVEIEPAYRAGLARAYAVRFTGAELADLSTYFDTPVGKKYAAESFLIFADPQVMSAMNEVMPAMMQRMPAMMEMMGEAAGQFPEGRRFSDLDAEERAQLATLLGVSEEDLATSEPVATATDF